MVAESHSICTAICLAYCTYGSFIFPSRRISQNDMPASTSNSSDDGEYCALEMTVKSADASIDVEAKPATRRLLNDEQILAHYGKRQQYRRNFGLVSILGLGCTLSTLAV